MLQVLPELRPDGERHVTEHREDLRLDGAVHVVVAEVGEENLHDLVSEAADEPGAHGSADVAHQAHGAIGFTKEHVLHRFTRRLWAWRDEFGGESEWAFALGEMVARNGPDSLWPLVASR